MNSIKTKISNASISSEPFPHLVIDELLDKSDFEKLKNNVNFCLNKDSESLDESEVLRKALDTSILDRDEMINKLSETLFSSEIKNSLINKFKSSRKPFSKNVELISSRPLLVYNPKISKRTSPREPHFDPQYSYLTWLFYIKDEADEYTKVHLYNYKNGFKGFDYSVEDKMYIKQDSIVLNKSIEAIPNRFFAFLVDERSVHSVSERKVNSGVRAYLTGGITSKNNKKIYFPFKSLSLKDKLIFIILRPIQRIKFKIRSLFYKRS